MQRGSGRGMLTPRERIEAALHGAWADQVPFSIYWNMLPRGDVERRLRNEGLAVVEWVRPYRVEMPHVEVATRDVYRDGVPMRIETVQTPVGDVCSVLRQESGYGTSWWRVEHPIKRPEDYGVVEFMLADTRFVPAHDACRLAQERLGEDGYVFARLLDVPMHRMMYEFMGIERFSFDLYERPNDFFRLHELLWAKHREAIALAAESTTEFIMCGTNFHQDMIGLKRFEEYYVPYLNEVADELHAAGKLVACHFDGPMSSLVGAVKDLRIDVVEALTPPPTCDVSVAEARAAWPDKVLWINFPSSVHAEPPDVIRRHTREILSQAAPGARFLMGVTENVPESAWRTSLTQISEIIRDEGRLPLQAEFGQSQEMK